MEATRWNPYICSDCRAIIRVPRGYTGKGIVCPTCDRMLRLPTADDIIPPLTSSPHPQTSSPLPATSPAPELTTPHIHKRRKHRSREGSAGEWENLESVNGHIRQTHSNKKNNTPIFIVAGLLLAASIALIILMTGDKKPDKSTTESTPPPLVSVNTTQENTNLTKNTDNVPKESTLIEAAKKFLEADNLESLAAASRPVPNLTEKIRTFYQQEPYKKPGFTTFAEDGNIAYENGIAYAIVTTADFEKREIALCKQPDGTLLADWEAWVGYCEPSFSQITQKRHHDIITVRAICKPETYYNFDFPASEEKNWQSYRINDLTGEYILHAYVERGSEQEKQMRLSSDEDQKALILKLTYPNHSTRLDQLIVTEVVHQDWILPLEKK